MTLIKKSMLSKTSILRFIPLSATRLISRTVPFE